MDVPRRSSSTQLAFHLADRWRNPVLVFGDYYLAHTAVGRRRPRRLRRPSRPTTGRSTEPRAAPATPGSSRRSARAKHGADSGYDLTTYCECARATEDDARGHRAARRDRVLRRRRRRRRRVRHPGEVRARRGARACAPRAPASATCARSRCSRSRARSLAARRRRRAPVAVYENNQGQMVDDVRLALEGAVAGAVHRGAEPRQLGLRHRARPRRRDYLRDPHSWEVLAMR